MDSSGEVLGATYFGPVAGSPLIPPEAITAYFILFLALLSGGYIFLHRKHQPAIISHKIKLLVLAILAIKGFLIGSGVLIAAYWLVPSPNIQSATPAKDERNFSTTQRFEIIFDRPIDRSELVKSISPEIPGFWIYENSVYSTHLYRKLVFIPTQSLKSDTQYQIKLSNIKNLLNFSKPYDHTYSFKTRPSPRVEVVTPVSGSEKVDISSEIVVKLSDPNDKVSQFDFELIPAHPFSYKLNGDKNTYTLTPDEPFKQGTKYQLVVKKTDLSYDLPTNRIIEQSPTQIVYDGTLITKEAPGLKEFSPSGSSVSRDSPISLIFSQDMDRASVVQNFSIEPNIVGTFNWVNDQSLVFRPTGLLPDKTYKVVIKKGAKAKASGFLEQDIAKSFTTIGRARVISFYPANGWNAASIESPIRVEFNQEVDKSSAQGKFSINPQAEGSFSWEGNTLIFRPTKKFPFSTKYTVTITSGVRTIKGQDSNTQFQSSFTTQEETVKLAVPAYLQKYSLSCELASLRMALAYKGVGVSEDEILSKLGVDPTPHQGDIWGNPHNAFVGNINGRQMADGYGVHWEPIARVGNSYKSATAFQNWSISQLTQAISSGNPVVIWVYSGGGWPTTWRTPDGITINAARDEHAVTAVGFVGPADNPSQIIINDPLIGQVYWGRGLFDKKWAIFSRSGVVIN